MLTFSALVVNKLGTQVLGGTNFLKENDISFRMASDTIVIKGNNVFKSTPPEILKMDLNVKANLVKADKSQVVLHGDYVECNLPPECPPNEAYFLDPRYDVGHFSSSPKMVIAKDSKIRIENESDYPAKLKKNTAIAQVRLAEPFPSTGFDHKLSAPEEQYSLHFREPLPSPFPVIEPGSTEVFSQIQFN